MLTKIPFTVLRAPAVYCKARRKNLGMLDCIDLFVNANAIPDRKNSCYRCHQGQKTRSQFACS